MECLHNCWFKNPDDDFDIEYASDSSVGLAASDNESKDIYDNDSNNTTLTHNDNICNQCPIHQATIIELRAMLLEQKRDDLITIKELKNKYNKLLSKYNEKKELLKQFAVSHINETEKIENIINEMERLSNNNEQILQQKHNIEREYEELKNKNLSLQLQINTHDQIVHQLKIDESRLKEEYRDHSTKLLKELNDLKQENMSFVHYKPNNNNNIWAHFDDNKVITRSRSRSAPEQSESDGSESYEDTNTNMSVLVQTQSISKSIVNNELPSIDEQKEAANTLIRNRSLSSDGTYDYDDNELSVNDSNGPQFIIHSPSQQSLWQQRSYESYNSYDSFHHAPPKPASFAGKQVSFSKNSGLDTPISPLTVFGGESFFENTYNGNVSNNRKLNKISSGAIYFDNNGIDVTDDNDETKDTNDNEYDYDDIKVDNNKSNLETGVTQIMNDKLKSVSDANVSLKVKNEKLQEEIKKLQIQLEMNNQ